jgi:hypothetical protein
MFEDAEEDALVFALRKLMDTKARPEDRRVVVVGPPEGLQSLVIALGETLTQELQRRFTLILGEQNLFIWDCVSNEFLLVVANNRNSIPVDFVQAVVVHVAAKPFPPNEIRMILSAALHRAS